MIDGEVRYEEIHWGVHGCRLLGEIDGETCWRPAALLWGRDENGPGTPACLVCADYLLERVEAIAMGGEPELVLP